MIQKLIRYLHQMRSLQRVNIALSRAAANIALRKVDPVHPATWEFSGFSQNGEDGILEVLTSRILQPTRYFIEIGSSHGLENNTTWLALARRFSGLMIEGEAKDSEASRFILGSYHFGVEHICMFVTKENIGQLKEMSLTLTPDVFSLDIDGNDYHLCETVLSAGFKPRVAIVEYNSAFGPERALTIPYKSDFRVTNARGESLYYGCSIAAWRKLFARFGYRFVTVDQNGVNAIFADPAAFDPAFLDNVKGLAFAENYSHSREYKSRWPQQFELIQKRPLVEV